MLTAWAVSVKGGFKEKIRTLTIVKIKNIKNDIFKSLQNSKVNHKTPKTKT